MATRTKPKAPEIEGHFIGNQPLPEYLAGPFTVGLQFTETGPIREQMSKLAALIERITERAGDSWHVEAKPLDTWYEEQVLGAGPLASYYDSMRFGRQLSLAPRFTDPADLGERARLATILGDALSDTEILFPLSQLIDWALEPLARSLRLAAGSRDTYPVIVPNTPARHQALDALRAARAAPLAPFLAGQRLLRDHATFRAFHTELAPPEAGAVASLVRSGKLELGKLGAGYDNELRSLALRGWCRIDAAVIPATYGHPARKAELAIRVGLARKLWSQETLVT